ncbi:MAG: dihydrofolate reductase [Pseudomonadales bacterium]|nr:dihydrofolate reductase [Candidatus Woesebacteria bacterium]MCB9801342.1 dihydrofolate reductase [Pseudomonadales bacterium]
MKSIKVTLIAALTADGYIGQNDAHLSTRWTSREDGAFFAKVSKEIGQMVLGSKTFATFNRKLSDRKMYVYSSRVGVENPHGNEIEVVSEEPASLVARLAEEGVEELLICGGTSVYTMFLQAGVIDRLLLTYEPVIFGDGVRLFNAPVDVNVRLTKVYDLSDQTKVHEYEVIHE